MKSSESITFSFPDFGLTFAAGEALINGEPFAGKLTGLATESKRLAGIDGESVFETFEAVGLTLVRETWTASDCSFFALRYSVKNTSSADFSLSAVRVVNAGGKDVDLAGVPSKSWRAFLDQQHCIGGIPSAVRLCELDESYQTAVTNLYWSKKEHDDLLASKPTAIRFGNFCLLDSGDDAAPKLLVGFAEFAHHYADMNIATDAKRTGLKSLTATATFDCILPPGVTRTTQFIVALAAPTHNVALDRYMDIVGQLANIPSLPADPPPSVGCTWHYYGAFIDEQTVIDNVEAAAKRNVPLDVFLIDDFWEPCYGDWFAVPERFPNGMRYLADKIRAAGMRPGIWTTPFAMKPRSEAARLYDSILFRDASGEKVKFYGDYMVDPTAPGALQWIEDLYRRLHQDYGFEYFKLDKVDFASYEWRKQNAVCHDRSVTLIEAYRRVIAAVRNAVGPDSYICVCGGHFGASLGLGDTQRCSADTYGRWYTKDGDANVPLEELRLKQTLGRLHYRRLFHTNPDGMEIRYQEKNLNERDFGLSVGHFTEDEAVLTAVMSYVAGGIVMCGESLVNIGDDRLAIYRRVIPSTNALSHTVDLFRPWLPSQYVTHIVPKCAALEPWNTVSVFNVSEGAEKMSVKLVGDVTDGIEAPAYLAYETVEGKFLGLFKAGATVSLGKLPRHSARVVKLIPVRTDKAALYFLGTDLHFSGGGVEITDWRVTGPSSAEGVVETRWTQYPIHLAACLVASDGTCTVAETELAPAGRAFQIKM